MFSLILVAISIGVAILLIALTQYYGDNSLSKGWDEADVAKSLNDLSQVKGALVAYNARTGTRATGLSDLVGKELRYIPDGWGTTLPSLTAFEISSVYGATEEKRRDACVEVNRRLGMELSEPPSCDTIGTNFTGCCQSPTTP